MENLAKCLSVRALAAQESAGESREDHGGGQRRGRHSRGPFLAHLPAWSARPPGLSVGEASSTGHPSGSSPPRPGGGPSGAASSQPLPACVHTLDGREISRGITGTPVLFWQEGEKGGETHACVDARLRALKRGYKSW